DGWRSQVVAQRGPGAWKGLYTVVSLVGFGLIVWGYGQARLAPQVLWASPAWTRHSAGLLVLLAMVLLVAAYVPANGIKARLHHPMVLAGKVWALAHLLANNTLADVLLFGSFLLWAVLDFRSARQRDRVAGTRYPAGTLGATALTVALGVALWAVFAFWLHALLFGVRPFGG
ncbi:MAG: NnrU family protein, partial [Microbacteriaceae bacterium]|nr:NnrU family protein [Burkholderiaceae bacterium]